MSLVMTPPAVSMPSDSGATSSSRMSCVILDWSPVRMAACTAAPYATASSGLMERFSSLPLKYSDSSAHTLGMRVEPPTSTISSMLPLDILESRITRSTGSMVLRNRSMHSSSNFARVIFVAKSTPSNSASTSMVVSADADRVRLARSHAVLKRLSARLFPDGSFLCLRLNSCKHHVTSRLSKSSPPRCVSPAVAFTSKMPSSIVSSDTSNVPPPRSKIRMFSSPLLGLSPVPFLSRPYAMAAAVGSLMMRSTFRPAMAPASLVAWRCPSLKYAGTVTTASVTSVPK